MAGSCSMPLILMIEDNAFIRANGVEMLQDAGYSVIHASSADDAIQLLERENSVRLIFTDIDMPGDIDGVSLAKLVHIRWPHIQVLLTSGESTLPEGELPEQDRFVAKPYVSSVIISQIDAMLRD